MIAQTVSTDKLGQQVNIGATVLATFLVGRSHHFMLATVTGITQQFAVLGRVDGKEGTFIFPRRCRFYNLVVVDKLVPQEGRGAHNTAEMMQDG